MINIYCTNKLKKYLSTKISDGKPDESIWQWNANLVVLNRKNYLLFVEKETAFLVVLRNITKKNLPQLETLFKEKLIEQFYLDGVIDESEESRIRAKMGKALFFPTDGDRKTLGLLNDAVNRVSYWWEVRSPDYLVATERYLDHYANENPVTVFGYKTSKSLMRKKVEGFLKD